MKESRGLSICGLDYRVIYGSSDEVPGLEANEGWTSCGTNTIYVRSGLPRSRARDVLVHEVFHAFLEASGVGALLAQHYRGDDFEKFEETLVRLMVPSILRLIDDNGSALVDVPGTQADSRCTKARTKRGARS